MASDMHYEQGCGLFTQLEKCEIKRDETQNDDTHADKMIKSRNENRISEGEYYVRKSDDNDMKVVENK